MACVNFDDVAIAVLGEAIMDLLPNKDGSYSPCVGGSPYNVARALGKQNVRSAYLSPLSSDRFGNLLADQLKDDAVVIDSAFVCHQPTSLAVVNLDSQGVPSYSLYRDGIADRAYEASQIIDRLPKTLAVFHTGSLAIVPEDMPKILEIFSVLKARNIMISVDLNVRPNVVSDHQAYIDGLMALVPYCDLLKASDEDLRFLGMDDWRTSAQDLFAEMDGGVIAVTTGQQGAWIANAKGQAEMPAFSLSQIEDTVGAGDSFQAGLLSVMYQSKLLSKKAISTCSEKELSKLLRWASATAAINVTRKGCNPPTYNDVNDFLSVS